MKTVQRATEAVAALEAVADGEAFATPRDRAVELCEALRAEHHPTLFRGIEPLDAAVILAYREARDSFAVASFAASAARLHEEALAGWPALARMVRGPFGRRDVLEAGHSDPARGDRAADEHARQTLARFETAVAAQLVSDPELGASARILAETVPALEARITAAVSRLQEHLAAEAARRHEQDRARFAALDAATSARREAVAAFFEARPDLFLLRGMTLTGADLAALARKTAAYDRASGHLVSSVQLEELERLQRKTQAADGVVA